MNQLLTTASFDLLLVRLLAECCLNLLPCPEERYLTSQVDKIPGIGSGPKGYNDGDASNVAAESSFNSVRGSLTCHSMQCITNKSMLQASAEKALHHSSA